MYPQKSYKYWYHGTERERAPLTIIIIIVILTIIIVTQPRVYENHINWIADPAPPASRLFDEMTSPAPAPAVPTPPAEVHLRLPGRLRSRRRRRRKAAASANRNSASRQAGLAIPPCGQPMRIRPAWLPAQRPGRGQQPIEIRRFLGISLESASL